MTQRATIQVMGGCASEFGPVSTGAPAIGFVDNATVANGRPVPLRMPELWPDAVPDHMKYLAKVNSEWRFSEGKRDYCTHIDAFGDQLIWTERGKVPMKEINKKQMALGVANPKMPPVVLANGPIGISKVVGSVAAGGGTHPSGRTRYVRVAYEIETGILPPCPAGAVALTADAQTITWTWTTADIGMDVTRIIVFAGYERGEEVHVATLEPGLEEWMDDGLASDSGVLASDYESDYSYAYVYTLVREVDGIVDESGPSPLSQSVSGSVVRRVLLSEETDGLTDGLTDKVQWKPADGPWSITSAIGGSQMVGDHVLALNASGDEWSATFDHNVYFFAGQRLLLQASQDSGAVQKFYQATVKSAELAAMSLEVDGLTPEDVALFDAGSIWVHESFGADVLGVEDAGPDGMKVSLSAPVSWAVGDKIYLRKAGLDDQGDPVNDEGWDRRPLKVEKVDPDFQAVYVVDYEAFTPSTTTLAAYATRCRFTHTASYNVPRAGTVFEITLDGKLYRAKVLSGAELESGEKLWLLEGLIPTTLSSTGLVQWAESSSYFTKRILWRVGGTGNYRLVAELPMDQTEFLDTLPDSKLGDVIRTYYQNSLGFIVFAPPPDDLHGLRSHAQTYWGISGFRVRAAEPGYPDAWPDIYEWTFPTRPQRVESYNGALIVFCSDAIYRIDGSLPENAIQSITRATDGCLAADTVTVAGGQIFYVGYRGLMAFNGQTSEVVAEGRIPQSFWRMPSVYTANDFPGSLGNMLAIPSRHTAGYQRISEFPAVQESGLSEARETRGPIQGLAAFYTAGKYVAYWRSGSEENQANGCVIVDLSDRSVPVTMSGLRIRDAWVDEYETPWLLLPAPSDSRLNSYQLKWLPDEVVTQAYEDLTATGDYELDQYGNAKVDPKILWDEMPDQVSICQTLGGANLKLLHVYFRDGAMVDPYTDDAPFDLTYTVTISPEPPAGTFFVQDEQWATITKDGEPDIKYVVKPIILRGEAGNALPLGSYEITAQCNQFPEKITKAKVNILPDFAISHSWHSIDPIEPGHSLVRMRLRVWPTTNIGTDLGVIRLSSNDMFDAGTEPHSGQNAGEILVWAETLLGSTLYGFNQDSAKNQGAALSFAPAPCIVETNLGARRKWVVGGNGQRSGYRPLTAGFTGMSPEFRMSSGIAELTPAASVLKASNGKVYVAGGSDAFASESQSLVSGSFDMTLPLESYRTTVSDVLGEVELTVNPEAPDANKIRAFGWKNIYGGRSKVWTLNFAQRRLDEVIDLGESKMRPIIHEEAGEVVVLGGSAYMLPRAMDGMAKTMDVSASGEHGIPTAESPLTPTACGWSGEGLAMYAAIIRDGGQDSCLNTWYAGADQNDPDQRLFKVTDRRIAANMPAAYVQDGPSVIQTVKYGGAGASVYGNVFYGLDGRVIR